MAEVKHTLRVEGGANSHFFDGCLLDQDGKCLAFVDLDHPLTPVIAAAPDLFEAVQALLNTSGARKSGYDAFEYSKAVALAENALSKATAQQEGR